MSDSEYESEYDDDDDDSKEEAPAIAQPLLRLPSTPTSWELKRVNGGR